MKTILIVDDQKTVLLTLEAILKKEKYVVIPCTNSIDAFDRFNREHIDCIITDAIMPMGTNGYNLISTIRQHSKNNQVPIIMLTGKREQNDIQKGLSAGANDYMIKPVDPDILLSKIKGYFQSQDRSAADFVHAPVNQIAQLTSKSEVVSVSEVQVLIKSNYGLIPGEVYKLSSDFFRQFSLESVAIRIINAEKVVAGESYYLITGQYVGLNERELAPIRSWIRSTLISSKAS